MKTHLTNKKGFTLVEITISLTLFALLIGGLIKIGMLFHRHHTKISKLASTQLEADHIRSLIQSDINKGGELSIDKDHRGIVIRHKDNIRSYYHKDLGIYLNDGRTQRKLTEIPAAYGIWVYRSGVITMTINFQTPNLNTREIDNIRVIKDVYTPLKEDGK